MQNLILSGINDWIMPIILLAGLAVLFIFQFVSGRKKNKQRQDLLNSLGVGTRVLTIGGMYGEVSGITPDNKLIVNVGTQESQTLIVLDRQSVRNLVDGYAANAVPQNTVKPAPAAVKNEEIKKDAADKAE